MRSKEIDLLDATLYVVSTPIGNLKDITVRAIDVLSQVDLIAAEDTRHTRILLQHYNINTPTTSYFDFNKEKKGPILINKLAQGQKIAIVSDAGTPGISDPAYRLIRECIDRDISVQTVPGATAFVPALILSGLPTDRFAFEGFLPRKKGRRKRLQALENEERTLIFYESAKRLPRTLSDLAGFFAERPAALVREITKKFEEVVRGTVGELQSMLSKMTLKGEFVIVVQGKGK